jgi:TolA-binding protein
VSAAAPTPPAPPQPPAEGESVTVTRAEWEELQKRIREFEESTARLRDADTRAEEQRREREQREAAERLESTAQRIGLAPADVGEIRSWIRSETKEAVREALDEIAEVRRTEDGDPPAPGDPPAATLADLADDPSRQPAPPAPGDPPAPPAPPTPPAPPEEPPRREHWFHRPLGGNPPSGDGDA